MVSGLAQRASTAEQVRACLEARGWLAELSPGGRGVYHLWATKGRRVWLVHVQPPGSGPGDPVEGGHQLDLEARQLRATPVVAGLLAGAGWFASPRTGQLLEP